MKPSPSGNINVIQFKDLGEANNNYRVNLNALIKVHIERPKPRDFIRPGDLIFRSRGEKFNAVLVDTACPDTIITAPLFRIRTNSEKVLPEYLLWFINQPTARAYFLKYAEGTMLKMINKKTLGNLPIILPPQDLQQTIAKLYALANQEQTLLDSIKQRRQHYIHGALMRMASKRTITHRGDIQ